MHSLILCIEGMTRLFWRPVHTTQKSNRIQTGLKIGPMHIALSVFTQTTKAKLCRYHVQMSHQSTSIRFKPLPEMVWDLTGLSLTGLNVHWLNPLAMWTHVLSVQVWTGLLLNYSVSTSTKTHWKVSSVNRGHMVVIVTIRLLRTFYTTPLHSACKGHWRRQGELQTTKSARGCSWWHTCTSF